MIMQLSDQCMILLMVMMMAVRMIDRRVMQTSRGGLLVISLMFRDGSHYQFG